MDKNFLMNISVAFIKEGNSIVAYAPALDLSTVGKNKKEAKQRFEEAASMFIEDVSESNSIEEVLRSLGWKKKEKHWQAPEIISQESVRVSVPALA